MAICIFCGGACGRVCRGLGFKSSDGGVESRHAEFPSDRSGKLVATTGRKSDPAGVAPGPSEAKKTRAPRGTFDRKTYQRDLMRKRRAAEKDRRI